MQFTGMYPDGDLFNRRSECVGTFNTVWNRGILQKTNTRGKGEHRWVQASLDSYHADQANINDAIKKWKLKKEEQESSGDPSRGAWEEAFDYFIQQLERNRTCERSEETSSSQESEYSEQDPGEEEELAGRKTKNLMVKKRQGSPIHHVIKKKKKNLMEEATDVDNNRTEEEIK